MVMGKYLKNWHDFLACISKNIMKNYEQKKCIFNQSFFDASNDYRKFTYSLEKNWIVRLNVLKEI